MRSVAAAQRGLSQKGWLSEGLGAPVEAAALDSGFCCRRYLFQLVWLVRLGWSIELTLVAGRRRLGTRKSEVLGWGWQRLPEMEKLHRGWGWLSRRPRRHRILRARKLAVL